MTQITLKKALAAIVADAGIEWIVERSSQQAWCQDVQDVVNTLETAR